MLHLFPKCRGYMIMSCAITFMLSAALFSIGQKIPAVLLLLLGFFAARFFAEYNALKEHQKLLSLLYYKKAPAQFISIYEPLIQNPKLRDNVRFTMQSHLVNAHIIAGEFDTALEKLDHMPSFPVSSEAFGKSLITGNRCLIYCHLEDVEKAEELYQEFVTYGESITRKQQRFSYIESKTILTIRIKMLKNKCSKQDAYDLRERLKKQITPLQQAEFQYLLGRVYLVLKENTFAKASFQEAANAGDTLFVARKAKEYL